MQILQGIAVSPGLVIGHACVIGNDGIHVPHRRIATGGCQAELARLKQAITDLAKELDENRNRISGQLGRQYGDIFAAHGLMLRDPKLLEQLDQLIGEQCYSAEWAVQTVFRKYAKVLQSLENRFIAQRAEDLVDVEKSLLSRLLGTSRRRLDQMTEPAIVLAHTLTPGETARMDNRMVLGFATEMGGPGGHTSIVAEALEIPAIVGMGSHLANVEHGTPMILDGNAGRLIVDPDSSTLDNYQNEIEKEREQAVQLISFKLQNATTADGTRIQLSANIEFPHEVQGCLDRGADGVGLYRTEFLYLGSSSGSREPTEQEHYDAYVQVVEAMQDRPVVIRTLDLGADKIDRNPISDHDERNPFLGLRSIRFSLRNLTQFRTQLRAILRASAKGKIKVMFPLIATLGELRRAKMVLREVIEDLDEAKIDFDRDLQVGMMVEVPSAVVLLDRFAKEVDFVSIGTNDLVQYALAVDRGNKEVAELYRASDPAVLRLIKHSIETANQAGIDVSLCGQMCGNPVYAMLLLGFGLRHMSVRPSALLQIKRICRQVKLDQCEAVAAHAMQLDTAFEVDRYLQEELKKTIPSYTSP